MKKLKKTLISLAGATTLAVTISPIVSCKTTWVTPSMQEKDVWFNACDKIDVQTHNVNLISNLEFCFDSMMVLRGSFRIVKDEYETFTENGIRADYTKYWPNFKSWLSYKFQDRAWNLQKEDETHIGNLPDMLKDYFINHQDRFFWFHKSNNSVLIKLLPGAEFKYADIEFYDDCKLFKTVFLWSPDEGEEVERPTEGRKYSFSNYDAAKIDDDMEDYYSPTEVDTTSERKFCVYDSFYDATSTQSVRASKFHLSGIDPDMRTINLPMWGSDQDKQAIYILKKDKSVVKMDDWEWAWDSEDKILTVTNNNNKIEPGDRIFISVSYPTGIKASNVEMKREDIYR